MSEILSDLFSQILTLVLLPTSSTQSLPSFFNPQPRPPLPHTHTRSCACIAPVNMITPRTMRTNCWHRKQKSRNSSVIGSCGGAESVHSDYVLWWYSGTGICIRIINTGENTDARQHEPHHACHCLAVIYTFFILRFIVAADAAQMPRRCSLFSVRAYLNL